MHNGRQAYTGGHNITVALEKQGTDIKMWAGLIWLRAVSDGWLL
jgi:hypothetical protein